MNPVYPKPPMLLKFSTPSTRNRVEIHTRKTHAIVKPISHSVQNLKEAFTRCCKSKSFKSTGDVGELKYDRV